MGSANVMIDALSTNPMRGLTQGNSVNPLFVLPAILPGDLTALYLDGLYPAGQLGITAPQRLRVFPFGQAQAGSQFSMRVYGWSKFEAPPDSGTAVWLWYMIAELACTVSNTAGPPIPGPTAVSPYLLKADEQLCDTITLTQGALGPTGYLNSTGPGTDLPAFAVLELSGAKFFLFDFQQTDPIPMNVLWARGP